MLLDVELYLASNCGVEEAAQNQRCRPPPASPAGGGWHVRVVLAAVLLRGFAPLGKVAVEAARHSSYCEGAQEEILDEQGEHFSRTSPVDPTSRNQSVDIINVVF